MSIFSRDLAIDLGTSNTRICVEGKVVVNEPSVVAVRRSRRGHSEVVAVGRAANEMVGRTPHNVTAVRPLRGGVIADFESTEAMLRMLLPPMPLLKRLIRPRVVVAVTSDLTAVEKRAVRESALHAGAREVHLIEKAMAAAIGAGLAVNRPSGNLIVDIGGGTTEVAVISVSGVVCSNSSRVGGDRMNEALVRYAKRKYNLLIGDRTAELLKIRVGSAFPSDDMRTLEVRGRDLIGGIPKTVEINNEEAREALAEPIAEIIENVKLTLEETPAELSADIVERGIVMVGGGSLLTNFDVLLRQETGLPVTSAEDPLNAVAIGASRAIGEPHLFRDVTLGVS